MHTPAEQPKTTGPGQAETPRPPAGDTTAESSAQAPSPTQNEFAKPAESPDAMLGRSTSGTSGSGRTLALIQLLRPKHWIKNLFVYAALVFSLNLFDFSLLWLVTQAFLLFCIAASTVYVINDIADAEKDRQHPTKRRRPIASGRVSTQEAWTLAGLMLAVTIAWAAMLGWGGAIILGYLVLQVAYSFYLKHEVLLDVICIALGFVLRALAGGAVADLPISEWLLICTFTLCLFLGFSKRRMELGRLSATSGEFAKATGATRKVLLHYTTDLLNHLTSVTAGIAIMAFLLYTMDRDPSSPFPRVLLLYTIPLVVYGVFRFAMLAERGEYDGPTELILGDRPFQLTVVAWCIISTVLIYKSVTLGDGQN